MADSKPKAGRSRGACTDKGLEGRPDVRLLEGDCFEVLAQLESESVDAIVTDPPYGLEFMGKEWDRFRIDDPGTSRHRGEHAGSHGRITSGRGTLSRVTYGSGKRPTTCRCVGCGKRDQFRKSHKPCGGGEWRKELIDPHAAPPTSLAFQEWCRTWALEAKRVLKPGGHLLAFGGTRTHHRLACAIEGAGFEIRDSLLWLYGSGFPKSLDVSKAIDKAAGAERKETGPSRRHGGGVKGAASSFELPPEPHLLTAPATPEAAQWEGWGTALKPSHEPIVVARKPLIGTVAENVLEHGTGGINVRGCLIEHAGADDLATSLAKNPGRDDKVTSSTYGSDRPQQSVNLGGRWPANVVLSEEAAAELDGQSGKLTSGRLEPHHSAGGKTKNVYGDFANNKPTRSFGGDSGGASRFFYCAKTSQAERNAGLEGFDAKALNWSRGEESPGAFQSAGTDRSSANHHPTVKPINLMRWLCRLVTPPGGLILDPFLGSGTTGCAAVLEGFDFIGIEREAEYIAIAKVRIRFWARHQGREVKEVLGRRSERQRKSKGGR